MQERRWQVFNWFENRPKWDLPAEQRRRSDAQVLDRANDCLNGKTPWELVFQSKYLLIRQHGRWVQAYIHDELL